MDQLRNEITALKNQLESCGTMGNAIERRTINHLKRLIAADEKDFGLYFEDLNRFWLSSVDWCSELSKHIEKLIILHEDLLGNEEQPPDYDNLR